MIVIESSDDGAILPVKAQAGARKAELRGEQDGALKVAVTQVAEKGKANKAIIALLSKQLNLRKSQIQLVSGETSSQKKFLIRDISVEHLQAIVDSVIIAHQ